MSGAWSDCSVSALATQTRIWILPGASSIVIPSHSTGTVYIDIDIGSFLLPVELFEIEENKIPQCFIGWTPPYFISFIIWRINVCNMDWVWTGIAFPLTVSLVWLTFVFFFFFLQVETFKLLAFSIKLKKVVFMNLVVYSSALLQSTETGNQLWWQNRNQKKTLFSIAYIFYMPWQLLGFICICNRLSHMWASLWPSTSPECQFTEHQQ